MRGTVLYRASSLGCAWPLENEYIFLVFTLNSDVDSVPIQSFKLLNLYFICLVFIYLLYVVVVFLCVHNSCTSVVHTSKTPAKGESISDVSLLAQVSKMNIS